jgi:hypothetical protein
MQSAFQHQHAGALTEHQAVAASVERPAGLGRIVPAVRQRAGVAERGRERRKQRGLAAAGQHQVGLACAQDPHRLTDRLGTGRAGRPDRGGVAADAELDRDPGRGHVRQHTGQHVRADPQPSLAGVLDDLLFEQCQAADAGNDHRDPARVDVPAHLDAGVGQRVLGRAQRHHDGAVDEARLGCRQDADRIDRRAEPGHVDQAVQGMVRGRPDQAGASRAGRAEHPRGGGADGADQPHPAHRDACAHVRPFEPAEPVTTSR